MSGNFVRERQRIVYIYNIHVIYMYIIYVNNTLPLAHEISRHFWAAYGFSCIIRLYLLLISSKRICLHRFFFLLSYTRSISPANCSSKNFNLLRELHHGLAFLNRLSFHSSNALANQQTTLVITTT